MLGRASCAEPDTTHPVDSRTSFTVASEQLSSTTNSGAENVLS